MGRGLWILTLVALAAGCHRDLYERDAAPPSPPEPVSTCADEARAMHDWLAIMVAEGGQVLFVWTDFELPVLPGAHPTRIPIEPIVTIGERDVMFEGDLVAPDDLALRLREHPARRLVFEVDTRAPRDVVDRVERAAGEAGVEGLDQVYLPGAGSRLEPPGPSSIDADVDAITQSFRRRQFDGTSHDLGARVFGRCPQVAGVWVRVAQADAADRDAVIVEGIPAALLACDCQVEDAAARRALYLMIVGIDPHLYTTVPVDLR